MRWTIRWAALIKDHGEFRWFEVSNFCYEVCECRLHKDERQSQICYGLFYYFKKPHLSISRLGSKVSLLQISDCINGRLNNRLGVSFYGCKLSFCYILHFGYFCLYIFLNIITNRTNE